MTGYNAVLFERNNVADGQARPVVVGGMVVVEPVPQNGQPVICVARISERRCVGKIIIAVIHGNAFGFQPTERFKPDVPQFVFILHLINGESVLRGFQKSGFPLLLMFHPVLYSG